MKSPVAWSLRKGEPKKSGPTEGYFCPNESTEYYEVADEQTHSLVGYGKHVAQEKIRDGLREEVHRQAGRRSVMVEVLFRVG